MINSVGTISDEYLNMQIDLHKNIHYGVASLSFSPIVADFVKSFGIKSISDYGAGKKNLLVGLNKEGLGEESFDYFPYDPVFPDYGNPKPADLVCCIDVLEHVEEFYLDNVLSELASITTTLGFFSIHMGPATKYLADGRNAHIIQKSTSWWLPKLCVYFEILCLQQHNFGGSGFWILVKPKSI